MHDDDDSQSCQKDAAGEETYFTREQLRDAFRMKPAPGAEPARMNKNPYGRKYGVWRLADCVPMREKRPQTESQRQVSVRLGYEARMKNEREWLSMQAHLWLNQAPLFLSIRTTGTGDNAQVLEIGLVNVRGGAVYHARMKPVVSTGPRSAAGHGIRDALLADVPSWPDVVAQLQQHIVRQPLVIFNAGFVIRILKQTAAAYHAPAGWLDRLTVYCAMQLSAAYYGDALQYGPLSLTRAASLAGLSQKERAPSAVADAAVAAGVVRSMAGYWQRQLRETGNDAGDEV